MLNVLGHFSSKELKPFDLSRFESLGDNCEFGFFLRQAGDERSSFFRWVSVPDYSKMVLFLRNGLSTPFNLYHLLPLQDHMVQTSKYKFGYHSEMHSSISDGKRIFCVDKDRIRAVYLHEVGKVKYLREKLLDTLKNEDKIFVVKTPNNSQKSEIKSLAKEIGKYGNCKLLRIMSTNKKRKMSKVRKVNKTLYYGYIDKFAHYNTSNIVSFDCWMSTLKEANRVIK